MGNSQTVTRNRMSLPTHKSALAMRLAEAGFDFGEPIAELAMNTVVKSPLGEGQGGWLIYQDPNEDGVTSRVSFLVAPVARWGYAEHLTREVVYLYEKDKQ